MRQHRSNINAGSHGADWLWGRRSVVVFASAALAVSCGGSDQVDASPTTAVVTTVVTTTSVVASTTVPDGTTSTTVPPSFTETSDMVYMTIDGAELLMDVYTPAGDGPWPVVVAFHGVDSRGKDSQDNIPVAEAAAEEGMVVFAPSWIVWDPPPFPFTSSTFDGWRQIVNCAVAVAQQGAPALGGDPDNTILYGFSGGAGAALIAAVQPTTESVDGCASDATPIPATGAVLGDGVYFLHNQDFDPAFDTELQAMQNEVAALVDPARWPTNLTARFRLWVADQGTNARTFADASDEAGWLALRDPTGSIRADLDQRGMLDDGVISTVDAGELLAFRLTESGLEATLDAYPGGHTVGNKVPELLGYLKELVGS